MKPVHAAAMLLCATLAASAHGASGQIDSFGASAATVSEGAWIDFTVSFSLSASSWSNGGSNLSEPAPQEGYQAWLLNWYSYESETIDEVQLQAGGSSFVAYPNVSGGGHSGTWTYSMLFPNAGTFDITVNGGWAAKVESYSSTESAWRNCSNIDPGGSNELACSSWTFEYGDINNNYSANGSFLPQTLTITVLAVPEPQTPALWLTGLAAGLGYRRHKMRHG